MTTNFSDIETWHRRLCPVTDQLVISGDLPSNPDVAQTKLAQWQDAGVTHILDTRAEYSDEQFVALHAPDIVYGWFGTHDNGTPQPNEWFNNGLAFAKKTLDTPGSVLLVHCHLGVNRGPSMAYRILLEQGWDSAAAMEAIQGARPIAQILYAADADDHHRRAVDASRSTS